MVNLGVLPGGRFSTSSASAVSADGSVVVGQSFFTGTNLAEAFRWTAETGMVGLGHLPGSPSPQSLAHAVSADGSVVVGQDFSASGIEAFRWTEASGMVGLGFTIALGVSADGSVVVGQGTPGAVIWDSINGTRSLRDLLVSQGDDLTGWTLFSATGISADGTVIVGAGINPTGQREAWLARVGAAQVIPEPSSLVLLGLGSLALLCCGWRRWIRTAPRGAV